MASQEFFITYVGGPTALLEFGGVKLLTDPVFDPAGGEYVTGPVTLRKIAGPALSPEALGTFDYVLLSHDHHADNLDNAGRALLANAKSVLTTEEGSGRLEGNSLGLRAWQSIDLAAPEGRMLRVVATPARHGPADGDRGPVIGFVFYFLDAPEHAVYFSGDTVWYEGVEEVAQRFSIRAAILNLGAARVPVVGPAHLTMTAVEGVEAARVFENAIVVPLHYEGWQHFSEGREDIVRAFKAASLDHRLLWLAPGRRTPVQL